MWRWMWRISGVFLFSSLFLTSTASADPHFYIHVGVPAVYPGYAYPGYVYPGYVYPGYVYPGYAYPGYVYPGYAYPRYVYPGYVYPRYSYPRYVWRDGYPRLYGNGYYWGGGRYARPYGRAAWTSGRWSHGGWNGGRGHWRR
jgi:hypothetical protein